MCRRARRRAESSYPQRWTASAYDPGPDFVPTMSPPPYDADSPPAYTITVGEAGADGSHVSADDTKLTQDHLLDDLPAYENCVSTADEV